MPNYPAMEIHAAYKGKKWVREEMDGIDVYRSWIYVSKNRSIISRLLNYFSFTFSSIWYHKRINEKFDAVLCESPPLFFRNQCLVDLEEKECKHDLQRIRFMAGIC